MSNFSPKTCFECGKPLAGRSDKRFCDAYCRNTYNNRNKASDELLIQQVNSIIRKNRRILKTLCPQGKATVRKETLVEMGFDFSHTSRLFHTATGLYYFCYDFGFRPIVERALTDGQLVEKVLIIQTQDFMNRTFDPWKNTANP